MKKQFFMLVISMLSLFLLSCKKGNVNSIDQTANLDAATMQALNSGNTIAIRQAYSLLNPEQKQTLWETKLNAILANDADKLSTDQKSIVFSIKHLLERKKVSGLLQNPKDGEAFVKTNLPYLQQHFDVHQLYLLLESSYFCNGFSLFKAKEYLDKLDNVSAKPATVKTNYIAEPPPNNCTCYYSISCQRDPQYTLCDDTINCTQVAECGLFGTSNCTGKCS